jgi:hypothetical protein
MLKVAITKYIKIILVSLVVFACSFPIMKDSYAGWGGCKTHCLGDNYDAVWSTIFGDWIFFDNSVCLQAPDKPNYFSPSVVIAARGCFAGGCWCNHVELQGWGECKMLNGSVIARHCARATPPGFHGNVTDRLPVPSSILSSNDPSCNGGCTCHPIDKASVNRNSPIMPNPSTCTTSAGKVCTCIPRVQICGYRDPADFMDTGMVSPFGSEDPNPNMAAVTEAKNDALIAAGTIGAVALLSGFPPLGAVAAITASLALLSEVVSAKMNHLVNAPHGYPWENNHKGLMIFTDNPPIGCIDYPAAPSPPAFCPIMQIPRPAPVVEKVCAVGERPTVINKCVLSSLKNTDGTRKYSSFEEPQVRVGFNNFIETCNDNNKEFCINFYASTSDFRNNNPILPIAGNPVSLPGTYTTDCDFTSVPFQLIYKCSDNPDASKPCIDFVGAKIANVFPATEGPYRLAYTYTLGDYISSPESYYCSNAGTSNCGTTTQATATLYGINDAKYQDLSFGFTKSFLGSELKNYQTTGTDPNIIQYPNVSGHTILSPETSRTIADTSQGSYGVARTYFTYIDVNAPTSICVYEKINTTGATSPYDKIECVSRPEQPKPVISSCIGNALCVNYPTSHMYPSMVVSLGSPSQSGVVGQSCSTNNLGNKLIGYKKCLEVKGVLYDPLSDLYLHGVKINALITDDSHTTIATNNCKMICSNGQTYTDISNVPNISGVTCEQFCLKPSNTPYYDNIGFKDDPGVRVGSQTQKGYLSGIEFYSGQYFRGGQLICLDGYKTKENVLAKKVNTTTLMPCPTTADPLKQCFVTKVSQELSDRLIPPASSGMSIADRSPMSPGDLSKSFLQAKDKANSSKICYSGRIYPTCPASNSTSVDNSLCCNSCPGIPAYCGTASSPCGTKCSLANGSCACNTAGLSPYNTENTCSPISSDLAYIINTDTEGTREKLPWELDLCTQVPVPLKCAANSDGGADNGNAEWEAAEVNTNPRFIKCKENYSQQQNGSGNTLTPSRLCYARGNTGKMGPVTNGCYPICKNDNNNNANWPDTVAGRSATGTCTGDYTNGTSGAPIRTCNLNGVNASWGAITNACVLKKDCPALSRTTVNAVVLGEVNNGSSTALHPRVGLSQYGGGQYFYCDNEKSTYYTGDTCHVTNGSPWLHYFSGRNINIQVYFDLTWTCQSNRTWSGPVRSSDTNTYNCTHHPHLSPWGCK